MTLPDKVKQMVANGIDQVYTSYQIRFPSLGHERAVEAARNWAEKWAISMMSPNPLEKSDYDFIDSELNKL